MKSVFFLEKEEEDWLVEFKRGRNKGSQSRRTGKVVPDIDPVASIIKIRITKVSPHHNVIFN